MLFRTAEENVTAHQPLAVLANGRFANHREEPRLQSRLTAVARFAFKNFQIDRLQDFFGFRRVTTAATQRPAETSAMEPFELLLYLRDVHRLYFHGIAPCFS